MNLKRFKRKMTACKESFVFNKGEFYKTKSNCSQILCICYSDANSLGHSIPSPLEEKCLARQSRFPLKLTYFGHTIGLDLFEKSISPEKKSRRFAIFGYFIYGIFILLLPHRQIPYLPLILQSSIQ